MGAFLNDILSNVGLSRRCACMTGSSLCISIFSRHVHMYVVLSGSCSLEIYESLGGAQSLSICVCSRNWKALGEDDIIS